MKVKICGITTKTALETAVEAGADFIGFVFFEKSKRNISVEKAKELAKFVPESVKTVGVFVDEPLENLLRIANEIPLDIVQLHGNETRQYCEKIPFEIIKAIKIIDGEFSQNPDDFPDTMLMFDAKTSGSGDRFDWYAPDFGKIKGRKFFIAGGLNPENVKEAIEYFSPFAVDVSSGVETDGQKDSDKIRRFLKNAHILE